MNKPKCLYTHKTIQGWCYEMTYIFEGCVLRGWNYEAEGVVRADGTIEREQ